MMGLLSLCLIAITFLQATVAAPAVSVRSPDVEKRFVKTIYSLTDSKEPDSGVEEPVSGIEKRFVKTIYSLTDSEEPVSDIEKRFVETIYLQIDSEEPDSGIEKRA